VGLVTVSLATKDDPHPGSTGVVVTVAAIDPHNDMAMLKTEDGAIYQLPKNASWKVGDRMECNVMEPSMRPELRLQNCRPWQ
jgi:hypothetical protein